MCVSIGINWIKSLILYSDDPFTIQFSKFCDSALIFINYSSSLFNSNFWKYYSDHRIQNGFLCKDCVSYQLGFKTSWMESSQGSIAITEETRLSLSPIKSAVAPPIPWPATIIFFVSIKGNFPNLRTNFAKSDFWISDISASSSTSLLYCFENHSCRTSYWPLGLEICSIRGVLDSKLLKLRTSGLFVSFSPSSEYTHVPSLKSGINTMKPWLASSCAKI